jgi:ABC-type polysaccharide/polyol phosphate transport system ATPase subunit
MSAPVAIDVVGVAKRFRLHHEKHQSLKERLIASKGRRGSYEDFWALDDISFQVAEGETIGVMGRNGSGKSTLLKLVSGILQPTRGKVVVRGTLSGLLELGAGFQPELSGRDNVYLNASLLGLSQREVERRFDEIVAFAELEQFIDNQVKFYSSGMYVRLGFAVAVNVDPDVLVIDEVLAVGDESFQRKCLDKIRTFQNEGRTILFVSHAPDLVRQICDRAVVLAHGKMLGLGPPGEAIRLFREHLLETEAQAAETAGPSQAAETTDAGQAPAHAGQAPAHAGQAPAHAGQAPAHAGEAPAHSGEVIVLPQVTPGGPEPLEQGGAVPAGVGAQRPLHDPASDEPGSHVHRMGDKIRLTCMELEKPADGARPYLLPGEPLTIHLSYEASEPVDDVIFTIVMHDSGGNLIYATDTEILGKLFDAPMGTGVVDVSFASVPLLDGLFLLTFGLRSRRGGVVYDWHEQECRFQVMNPGRATGAVALDTIVDMRVTPMG